MKLAVSAADSRLDLEMRHVAMFEVEADDLDVSAMSFDGYARPKVWQEPLAQFRDAWTRKWRPLIGARAWTVLWSTEELVDEFAPSIPASRKADADRLRDAVSRLGAVGVAAVWSIGADVTAASFDAVREEGCVPAMLLDVASSLCLGITRDKLRHDVGGRLTGGLVQIGEWTPDACTGTDEETELCVDLRLIADPWIAAGAPYSVAASGVLEPIKTQCAMFIFCDPAAKEAEGMSSINFSSVPCSDCKGARCLYAQFGGCHLPEEKQHWKRRSRE